MASELLTVDPTRPFGQSAESSNGEQLINGLVLQSIIHGDDIHTVVVSGKILKMFDYIDEYQLTAVNDKSVILRSKTQRIKLNIFKGNLVKVSVAK